MRLGVIGTGTIAGAVVRGIAGEGRRITVSERSHAVSEALSRAFPNVSVAGNQTVLDQSDVVFLGLMAEAAPEVLGALEFRAGQQVISFMAGAALDVVGQMVHPARAAALMLPFPAIATGGSPILAQGDTRLVERIFGARNSVVPVADDADMAACLCAQAVLSPVLRMVGDAADWLGERLSDPQKGEAFLRALVTSSLSASECAPLIEALNTPGGYNQRLRLFMEEGGMRERLRAGLDRLEGDG